MSAGTEGRRGLPSWPLFLIAAPAAVAVWSGWVGLGQLSGFGLVTPLPGIAPWHLDTAITLPVGVEAYASYALGAWLKPGAPPRAKSFAKRSAIGALGLGMLGQVVYHLLAAAHAHRAPWPVVVLVACLPVVTLGLGVALAHLLRPEPVTAAGAPGAVPAAVPETGTYPIDVPEPDTDPDIVPARWQAAGPPESLNGLGHAALAIYGAEARYGRVPSIRAIRERMSVGQPKAQLIQHYLRTFAAGDGGT